MLKVDKRDIFAYSLFLLVTLIFFHKFLSGEYIFAYRDLSLYFYPLRHLMVGLVKSGEIPLWNPYLYLGYPLLATLQVGFFYPLSLIYYLLPFHLAFNYYTILHYFLAASFMYMLMRYFSFSRPAAFLSGIVFSFSGYMLSAANMNTTLTSITWTPLVILFYDRLLQNRKALDFIALSCFLGIQFLGGEPTILYLTLLLLFLYTLFEEQKFWVGWGLLFGSLVLAAALTAVQLFPFLEVVSQSVRTTKTGFDFIAARSFPPREILNIVFPFFFGNLIGDATYIEALLGDKYQAWILSPYLGFFPLFFAFVSIRSENRKALFFWLVAIVGLFLAFGRFTPVYGFFFKFLPGISLIRWPVKYLFLSFFSFSVLAGMGFDLWQRIINEDRNKRLIGTLFFLFGLILILSIGHLWVRINLDKVLLFFRGFYPQGLGLYECFVLWKIINFNLISVYNLMLFIIGGLFLIYLICKKFISLAAFNLLFLLLIILDLLAANIAINPAANSERLRSETPAIAMLKNEKGLFRVFVAPQEKEETVFFRSFDDILNHDKEIFTANRLVPYRIASLLGRESIEPNSFKLDQNFDADLMQKVFLDRANVKYVQAFRPVQGMRLINQREVSGLNLYLYQNPGCFPRAFISDGLEALSVQRGSECEIVKYQANRVLIKVSNLKSGFLFFGDGFYPGWKAYVDAKEEEIFKAGDFFRGVPLAAGKHQIEFVYQPLSFIIGAFVSFSTVLAIFCAYGGIIKRGIFERK